MKTPNALVHVLPLAVAVACGSSERRSAARCHPIGKSDACECADGRHGAAVCRSDGSLSECVCTGESGGTAGDGGSDDGTGGVTSGASGTAPSGGTSAGVTGGGGARSGAGGGGGTGDGGDPSEGGEGGRGDAGVPTGGVGGGTGGACGPADVGGCRCPDDALGYRLCVSGAFGTCTCDGGTGGSAGGGSPGTGGFGTCQPETELCDQEDNDCDGVADNGFPCPDDSVRNASPFTGGAYLQGTLQEGAGGYEALQQFWPTLSEDYITGFDSYANDYRFSRLDGTIFYYATFSGIFRNGVSETADDDTLVSTAPCDDSFIIDFELDATGTLFYACQNVLYKGDAEIVAGTFSAIAGVLDDGRIVLSRSSQFAVLNAQGRELSRFPPPKLFAGSVSVNPSATTIQDNRAYVALNRTYPPNEREVLVYRIDPDSTFRLVRRAPVSGANLVLSDGTIFVRGYEGTSLDERIVAYLPDNSTRVVWREAEATTVRAHIGEQVLAGPRFAR